MKQIKRHTFSFLLFCIFFTPTNGQQLKKYRILTYGLPNFEMENSKAVIANRWNIEFYSVAGCIIDSDLEDSVVKENAIVKKALTIKYGSNWRDKFDTEVDKEFKLQTKISNLLNEQPFIKNKQREIEKLEGSLDFKMYPAEKGSLYNIKVSGYEKLKNEYEYFTYYRLQVNYKTKSVKIVDDRKVKD